MKCADTVHAAEFFTLQFPFVNAHFRFCIAAHKIFAQRISEQFQIAVYLISWLN